MGMDDVGSWAMVKISQSLYQGKSLLCRGERLYRLLRVMVTRLCTLKRVSTPLGKGAEGGWGMVGRKTSYCRS